MYSTPASSSSTSSGSTAVTASAPNVASSDGSEGSPMSAAAAVFSAFNGPAASNRSPSPDTYQSASESAILELNSPHRKRRYKMQLSQPLDQYRCHVCSDRALGFNFDAVTCESCKAFFRRNAFKKLELKCNFSGMCSISVNTRKFCSPCRLEKCFAVGMKKELILNESQLRQRRQKTLSNRTRRCTAEASAPDSASSRQSTAEGQPHAATRCCGVNYKLEEEECFHQDESAGLNAPSGLSTVSDSSSTSDRSGSRHQTTVLNLLEECSDDLPSSVSEHSWQLYRPLGDTCSVIIEGIRTSLNSVINNVKAADSEQISAAASDKAMSLEMPFSITHNFVQRFVSFIKCLPEFSHIEMDDRINLIKGGVFHFILMRGVAIYSPDHDSFTFQSRAETGHTHSVSLTALSHALAAYPSGQQLIERYRQFMIGYHLASSGDQMALTLLQLVEFYNPSRPLLRNMHRIDLIQQGYMLLLKRYIESVRPMQQARRVFFDLTNRLSELDGLAADFSQLCHVVGFRCEELNPLLLEIFELSISSASGAAAARVSRPVLEPRPPPPPQPPLLPPYSVQGLQHQHQHHHHHQHQQQQQQQQFYASLLQQQQRSFPFKFEPRVPR